jgi:prepilin-type processing-associated H-X9-DG protein
VLIGILLPVLSGVQARGRDLKCQSNQKQIVQLLLAYAAENKGSLPFGWYPQNWNFDMPTSNIGDDFVSWASIISKMSRGKFGQMEDGLISSPFNAPFLKCPEASLAQNQLVSYVVNISAMPGPFDDVITIGGKLMKPAKQNLLFGHNILVHDTAVGVNSDESVGYLTNADVDDQRLWEGALSPQWRYFDPADRYARIPPGLYGNNKPVFMGQNWKNIDPQTDPPGYPYQGNLRFRHGKGTICYAAFADGHVEGFTAKFNADKSMKSHDVLRKLFMTKWPSGVRRNPGVP